MKEKIDIYRTIKGAKRVFIIGEAGVNHNGDLSLAKQLVDVAVEAGCDAVKFQTFKAEDLVSRKAAKAEYQKETTAAQESQFEMIKKLELDLPAHLELVRYCRKKKIIFLSTPFDEKSADLLSEIDIALFKIPSGEITNFPFLKYVAAKKKSIILSTGMSTLDEVRKAVHVIFAAGNKRLILLHCVTAYPTPLAQANLKAIETLARSFKLPVGYSDHTEGLEAALAAVALGAVVIEKHFTLDHNLPGPDHKASLEPPQLIELVSRIRVLEIALGDGIKRPVPCEKENIAVARKSVVTKEGLDKGQVITPAHIAIKRPGSGIAPADINKILGRTMRRNVGAEEVLTWKDIK